MVGTYQVNVSLTQLLSWVEQQRRDNGLQLNPDFQRGHVWTEEQQRAYVEYLLRGGTSGRTLYFNCVGWMTRNRRDFVCVDGLQRLTATMRFLRNELQVFGQFYSEFEDTLDMLNCLTFNVNNLQTRAEVLQWYLEMNSGGTVHTAEELNKVRTLLERESV